MEGPEVVTSDRGVGIRDEGGRCDDATHGAACLWGCGCVETAEQSRT